MTRNSDQKQAAVVRKRHVFYLSGFDPKGPAYYYAIYAEESQKQAAVNGMQITVGPVKRRGRMATCWQIDARSGGQETRTTYEFLRWDDIIRTHMLKSKPPFLLKTLRTYWLYFSTGALWKILKNGYPPFIAGIYPVVIMAALTALALILSTMACWLGVGGLGMPDWACAPITVAVLAAMIWAAPRLDKIMPYLWPVYVYNFAADQAHDRIEQIDERVDQFAERIADYIAASDDDEVLIVGHSNGTTVAISALARALQRDPGLGRHHPKVSLLTLGESILMLSLLPQAAGFRKEMQLAGGDNGVDWVDITAPRDGACFALTDPLTASGLARPDPPGAVKPKLLSIPITDLFSRETWRKSIRGHWLRIHFQYLLAYEKPTPYDYFTITAGSKTLGDRYRDFPSKSGFAKFKLFGK